MDQVYDHSLPAPLPSQLLHLLQVLGDFCDIRIEDSAQLLGDVAANSLSIEFRGQTRAFFLIAGLEATLSKEL